MTDSNFQTSRFHEVIPGVFACLLFVWAIISAPVAGFQFLVLGDIYLGTDYAKLVFVPFVALFVLFFFRCRLDTNLFLAFLFFLMVVLVSLLSVLVGFEDATLLYSSKVVGYYYFSLLCAFVFYLFFSGVRAGFVSIRFFEFVCRCIALFVLASFFEALYRVTAGGCVFGVVDCASLNELGFRVSNINEFQRAFSLQQRPLDLGIIFSFLCVFFLGFWVVKRSWVKLFLAFLCFATVGFTASRTAYVLLVFSLVFFYLLHPGFELKARLSIFVVGSLSALLILFYFFSGGGSGVFDPHNLLLRLEHWSEAFVLIFDNIYSFLFGLGRVQNGAFGEGHDMVIDNTYIGVMMAGGFVSLVLYAIFFVFLVRFVVICRPSKTSVCRISQTIELSVVLGFLVACFTENMLNRVYVVLYFCAFVRVFGFYLSQSYAGRGGLPESC